MKLTVLFESEGDVEWDAERSISVLNRDADDLDYVLRHWKHAYENAAGEPTRAILTSPIPNADISPEDIPCIDAVEFDTDAPAQ